MYLTKKIFKKASLNWEIDWFMSVQKSVRALEYVALKLIFIFRQDYHGGSLATNLNIGSLPVVLNPAPHYQVAIQEVADPQDAIQQVAGPQFAVQQVAGPQNAIQQVAGSDVAIQQVSRHHVAGQHAIQQVAGNQAALHQVAVHPAAQYPVTRHQVARFKRSPVLNAASRQQVVVQKVQTAPAPAVNTDGVNWALRNQADSDEDPELGNWNLHAPRQ